MAINIRGNTNLKGGVVNSTRKKTNINVEDNATLTTPKITNTGGSTYDVNLGNGGTLNYDGKTYQNQPVEDYYSNYLADIERANKLAQEKAAEAQRLRTEQAVTTNNAYIPQVNQQTDKQLQDAYIATQQAKVNAPQALSAMGYTGGAAESSLIGLDTTYQNQRGQMEQGRNDAINQIRQNEQQIRSTGDANLSDLASQYYNNLIQNQQQAQSMAQSQSNWQSEFDLNKQNQGKDDFINSLGAYYNDFQAKINEVQGDGDTSNDWQIAYLQQARAQKQLDQKDTQTQQRDIQTEQYQNILAQYKGGALSRAEANYLLQQYGLPTI